MKRFLWDIKRNYRKGLALLVKKIQAPFFPMTPSALKQTPYPKLPAPVYWNKIAQGREIVVEIGSGHGEVLLANDPQKSIAIGYEIKARFFLLTQRKIRKRSDIFVFKGSAYESLFIHYRDTSIARIYVLFPDPWHKRKHNKRRPLTAAFFSAAAQKLKKDGEIIIATDWEEYADFIKNEAARVTTLFVVQAKEYNAGDFGLPVTHYHQKWLRKGRKFTAIVLRKKS